MSACMIEATAKIIIIKKKLIFLLFNGAFRKDTHIGNVKRVAICMDLD